MPLTEAERAATRTILTYLSDEETVFLAETVSQRIVRAQTPAEAVEVILEFSNDFEQLLKRQKMKREYLQRFIMENRLPGRDGINAEKRILIRHILDFTGSIRSETTTTEVASSSSTTTSTTTANTQESTNNEPVDIDEMALMFANWFYDMLNSFPKERQSGRQLATSGNATSSKSTDSENTFGPHHFIENCCLNLRLESGGGGGGESFRHDETFRGGAAVAEKLAQFCLNDELVFNVNLDDDGCTGKKTEHGLIMLQTRGTLLRRSCLVGVFEQSFGLVKDPKLDNWKIQITNLAMKTGSNISSVADQIRALT